MSLLEVKVVEIENILPHTNADTLELAIIGGWQTVVKKDSHKIGDFVIYFPIDSVLPIELSDYIGVTGYLHNGRIRAIRLRQEPSYGLVANIDKIIEYIRTKTNDIPDLKEDIKDILGVTKYEPPAPSESSCMGKTKIAPYQHPLFFDYTDIDNYRNYKRIIEDGEMVRICEKLHGSNSRVGLVEGNILYGSHHRQILEDFDCIYCKAIPSNVLDMLHKIKEDTGAESIIAYGEIYGWIQDLKYNHKEGEHSYRLFDIRVKDKYLNYDKLIHYTSLFNIPIVPVLYTGPFSFDIIEKLKDTNSTLGNNMMEGVVITPLEERIHYKLGRVVLKYVFDRYLLRKKGTEHH